MSYGDYEVTKEGKRVIKIVVAAVLVLLLCLMSIVIIPSGTVGVVQTLGAVSSEPFREGIHLRFPLVTRVFKMDVRTQKVEATCDSASKDLQTISTVVAVNYRINAATTPELYKTVGRNYEEIIIAPAIQESVKSVTALYSAEQIITKRQEVSIKIAEQLSSKVEKYNIVIENFNIINLDFSEAFNAAIEAKQTAQQEALKAEQDLVRIKVEAEQTVARAQADADAARAKADAEAYTTKVMADADAYSIEIIQKQLAKSDLYLEYQKIQKWNGQLPYVQGDSSAIIDMREVMAQQE